ncbi:hypothetical protein [Paenibacillus lentus]|uniref:Uncharacterized protein n=1 Tax=Paenibacillus lentus TaxID=1338368 RepID=A0A3S8RTR4_9BACL|nr:hypothetical protein [Paenibacillus lentus]AZK46173.1 hypothetical protein EIM92_08175 [Paenibacillus lentus]
MVQFNAEEEQEEYVNKQIREAREGEYPEHKSIQDAENGSMVNDMEDLKQLSEDMDEMSTNSEDEARGLKPDPEQ